MTRTVYVVPHCHWDREWYQPHELFRWRLVQMIDELLDHMEAHPEFRCFNLDGQSIVIDDYLELRPENEGRLRSLIQQGRIVIGPWWVQPDEFLPSGESHIRSFQKGIRFAERLGGSLRIGHCADQFGHIAQMPQLMAGLGLTSACLWRGVPDSVPGWSFHWESPDGTRIPVLYLRNSYSSGWRLPTDPVELIERVRRQERDRRPDEPALLMNGTDHSRIERTVPQALAAAAGRGYDFQMVTLAEYERAQFAAGIDDHVHHGELRSPDNSNVLVGVLSARMNIKQRDFRVAAQIERYAEPLELLSWLHDGPDASPALRQAWRLQLENSPHDSICGCSVDQTHREMLPRYDRAEQLARQVSRESMAHLVKRLDVPAPGGLAIFRPVPHAAAVLECEVPADWLGTTALRRPDGTASPCTVEEWLQPGEVLYRERMTPEQALRHLDFIREGRYDAHYVEDMRWELDGRLLRLQTVVGDALTVVDDETVRREIHDIAANDLADTVEVSVVRTGRRVLRAVLPPDASVGVELLTRVTGKRPNAPLGLTTTQKSIANEFHHVSFRNGRLRIRDVRTNLEIKNANAVVSEADRGDEYNADILPGALEPTHTTFFAATDFGTHAELWYTQIFNVPMLNEKRSKRTGRARFLHVDVTVTLWRGLNRVDFRVKVVNHAADHRLRVLFPLPFIAPSAITENQFHVAERSLTPQPWNGRSDEQPPTAFPQKTFAAFEGNGLGLAVFNKGLPEGEVVTDKKGRQSYALTLLRCVGWLSRNDLKSRRGGAGPMIATPDAQMQGTHTFEFALTTYRGTWREANIQPMAHSFAYPPLAYVTNAHEGSVTSGAIPLVTLASPSIVPSAMHRSDETRASIIRVYNSAIASTPPGITIPAATTPLAAIDLLDRSTGDDAARHLRPWEIASFTVNSVSPSPASRESGEGVGG